MYRLAQRYLSSRTLSEAECYYKIDPTLSYKQSNVKTVFIHAGFPYNKQRFLNKCQTDDEIARGFKVSGHEGVFREIASRYERYLARPKSLEFISYFQFMQMYDVIPPDRKKQFVNLIDTVDSENLIPIIMCTDHLEYCKINSLNVFLPQVVSITVKTNNLLYKIRRRPSIVRMKRYSIITETHEFYYAEMTKFKPHRCENELFFKMNELEQCQTLYHDKNVSALSVTKNTFHKEKVAEVKALLLPTFKEIDNLHELIKTMQSELCLDSMFEEIEPEDEPLDVNEETVEELLGLEPGPEHTSDEPMTSRVPFYHCIQIKDKLSLVFNASKLNADQFTAFKLIINYCFKLKTFGNVKSFQKPTPPRLIIEGGAGSGKSFTINAIRDWINYLLFSPGDHVDQPYLLVCAPTGMAATNVEGATIHSTFKFGYGNEYRKLGHKVRDKLIDAYKNVQIIIIDECSMISSDMLYNISKRLSEIKCNEEFFGGCAVILVGDFMQLRPIDNRYLFLPPHNKKLREFFNKNPLLNNFEAISLRQNHRQSDDSRFLNLLNEIRMKGRFENLTQENELLLLSRLQPVPPGEFAFKIFATNATCNAENTKQLNNLPGVEKIIYCKFVPDTYTPNVKEAGTVDDTPFVNELKLKIGARVLLKYNINVNDRLVNGSQGTIAEILEHNNLINLLLIKFDDERAGKEQREKFKYLQALRDNSRLTPIPKVEFQYFAPKTKKNVTLVQFPIKLSFAITSHSAQGMTIPYPTKLVTCFDDLFEGGMGYVIISRLQKLEQLFLQPFRMSKIYCRDEAKDFTLSLKQRAINLVPTVWMKQSFLKLASVNVRGMSGKIPILQNYFDFQYADVIFLQETWLNDVIPSPWTEHKLIQLNDGARGIAVAYKLTNAPIDILKINTPTANFILLVFPEILLINVYQFSGCSNINNFKLIVNLVQNFTLPTVFCGDFNIDLLKSENEFWLQSLPDMQQHITMPTHISGGLLDHVYTYSLRNSDLDLTIDDQSYAYFSDHTIQLISIKNNSDYRDYLQHTACEDS